MFSLIKQITFVLIIFLVSCSPVIGLAVLEAYNKANIYNKICKPKTPVTTSDMFWFSDLSTVGCNTEIKIRSRS